jgi:3-oxoacyl-[acyl-carrier protein] reductase
LPDGQAVFDDRIMTSVQDQAPAVRPVALVTGVGRTMGIGAGMARQLAESGWDIAFTYWNRYDERMAWGPEPGATSAIGGVLARYGAATAAIEADLADPQAPELIFDQAGQQLGGGDSPGDVPLRVGRLRHPRHHH